MNKVYKMFIGGKWLESVSGETIQSINPADETLLWEIQSGCKDDVDLAVSEASKAFHSSEWQSFSYKDRADLLREIATLIMDNAVRLSQIETAENGKPIKESSLIDVPEAAETFNTFASMVLQMQGECYPSDGSTFSYSFYEPLGVVGAIIPWNYPLLMAAWKIAPAIAAGNTIVIKPSENTSATLLELAKLLSQTTLPDGVINIITGYGEKVGVSLCDHPSIQKISFTGSTKTGIRISTQCAANLRPTTMELGGKSATIVLEDADWESTLRGVLTTIFMNQGQMCTAGSRLLLHESIATDFKIALIEKVSKFKIQNGDNPLTDMGPLISNVHCVKVSSMVEHALKDGAQSLIPADTFSLPETGYFFPPTILEGVKPDHTIWQEEVFGPVLILDTFDSVNEAIAKANNSDYALAVSVWGQNQYDIHKITRQIEAGRVWINTYGNFSNEVPFGGFKKSGHGKDLGLDALKSMCRKKAVTMDITEDKTPLVSRWYAV